jgi:hypothetical protein
MLHLFMEKGPWFRAKRLGYGAGLPFTWQGWTLLLGYIGVTFGVGFAEFEMDYTPRALAWGVWVFTTVAFLIIVHARTEGGWHWSWGDRAKADDEAEGQRRR